MDINLLDRIFEHNSAAAVANTADTTNSPAPTNPDVIAPATMHPLAKRAELVTSAT
ncbi:hypothetical protein [Wolbachia endosymbiont of Tetranychus urticae]|uniref:hypothetical protein n=1 Tax=Wolbachia endosymbiont of Tetranychus urticae TaxID=169184 RepID=UPI003979EEAF